MRIVVDTNLYVSALINANSRRRLDTLLLNNTFDILTDDTLLAELHEVVNRPKFRKYVSPAQIEEFIGRLLERTVFIETTSSVRFSPDPKDDFLLALCRDSQADYLLSGNKLDLLALRQFENTQILSLSEFLNLIP